jgi:hypothetical protein
VALIEGLPPETTGPQRVRDDPPKTSSLTGQGEKKPWRGKRPPVPEIVDPVFPKTGSINSGTGLRRRVSSLCDLQVWRVCSIPATLNLDIIKILSGTELELRFGGTKADG